MAAKNTGGKKKNDRIGPETRILAIVALLDICKTDADNIGTAEIENLYQKISELNKKTFEDEETFAVVEKHRLDEITNVDELRERIRRNRAINIYKELGYFNLSSGSITAHEMSGTEIISTILHETGVKTADELSAAACSGTLTDKEAEKFKNILNGKQGELKKRLAIDFAIYNSQKTKDPAVEAIRRDIEEYTYDKKKSASFEFDVHPKDKGFRKSVRKPFNDQAKPDFLKLYGTMLTEGRNLTLGNKTRSTYDRFRQKMEEAYGSDSLDSIIDRALGLSAQQSASPDADRLRQEAYAEKSKELYFKTLAGVLSQKYEYNLEHNSSTEWGNYVQTFNDKYIRELTENGYNYIDSLAFQDPNYKEQFASKAREHYMNKVLRDETAEMQIISVHHKDPIGSAKDLSNIFFKPALHGLDEEKAEAERIKLCSKMYNTNSNFMLVIGQAMHQSLEARDKVEIGQEQDTAIFAADINCRALRNIMTRLPANIREGMEKYVKPNDEGHKKIFAYMPFPEPKEKSFIRKKLQEGKDARVSLTDKFGRCYRE